MLGKVGAALTTVVVIGAAAAAGPTTGLARAAEEVSGSPTASGSASATPQESTSASSTPTPVDSASPPPHCDRVWYVNATVNVSIITAGNAPQLRGEALSPDTDDPCGYDSEARVQLFARQYGASTFALVDETTAGQQARYTFTLRPKVQTAYFVRMTSSMGVRQSDDVLVRVHRRIDITSTGPTFAGRLTPAEAPIAVGLAYIDANDRYRYLNQTVSDAQGNFSVSSRLPAGTFTYVIYTSPREGLLKGVRSVRFTN